MFIDAILKRFRKPDATVRHDTSVPAVDIELPLAVPTPPPALTPQQQWERVLSPAAHVWLVKLPVPVRPNHLADTFPRIANRLALVWRDVSQVDKVLDDLLVDKRGGRRGFPPEVSAELLRLHSFNERRRSAAPAVDGEDPGKAREPQLQASADR